MRTFGTAPIHAVVHPLPWPVVNDDLPLHLEPQPALTVGAFTLTYPEDLPITAHRDALVRAINDNQVIIVAGATGSGKSTQLPKLALEAGRGTAGMIARCATASAASVDGW